MGAYLCIATNKVPPSVSKRIIVDVECKYRLHIVVRVPGWSFGKYNTFNCNANVSTILYIKLEFCCCKGYKQI